jgi:hypothetical protein
LRVNVRDVLAGFDVLAEMEERLSDTLQNVIELRKLDAQLHPKGGR